ncbi:MAG: iron-sulfur cluster carrier protein ApbC [Nitrospirae bacterium]|nr:iron-sulfur cluster carrier protein ApbC [Nitrospirota bacterium]
MLTEQMVLDALRNVQEPELGKDIVSLNMVKDIVIEGDALTFTVQLTTPACPLKSEIDKRCREGLAGMPGLNRIDIKFGSHVRAGATNPQMQEMAPGIKNVIAVSSGKGGVGKTTVAVNLAVALARQGAKVGLLDADIYGPNVPKMMGLSKQPTSRDGKMVPPEAYGVHVMSMGFLVPEDTPLVWRGPMIHGAIQQFLKDVAWNEVDYLVVDLPPGTGDAQLSICQLMPVTGAVIVTTPQEVSLLDSRRGMAMFQKVNVPLLGIVENMSYFLCPHCSERTDIFSTGGGKAAAEKLGVEFLGAIPIDTAIRVGGDQGAPLVATCPESPQSQIITEIAQHIAAKIAVRNQGNVLRII